MQNRKIRILISLLLIVIYIVTCFFREFIFLNLNEQCRVTYDTVYLQRPTESFVTPSMQWLSTFSYPTLYYSKWGLTLLFTVIFAALASLIIHFGFNEKKYVKITWLSFSTVFIAGLLFYFIGYLLHNTSFTYDIARFLAGLVETPAMLVILCATFIALRRREKTF